MYNLGVLRTSLSSPTDVEDMPLEFGPHTEAFAHLSDQEKDYLRSELGKESIKSRWDRRDEALEKVKAEVRKRWLEWQLKGGRKIQHNKMADVFLEEMSEELSEAGVTRQMLIDAFREIAREIDTSLVYGVAIKK